MPEFLKLDSAGQWFMFGCLLGVGCLLALAWILDWMYSDKSRRGMR